MTVLFNAWHITGYFIGDLPSQSLDWCNTLSLFSTNHLTDINKTKHNCNQQQHKNLNSPTTKLLTYEQTKANKTKAWFNGLLCHAARKLITDVGRWHLRLFRRLHVCHSTDTVTDRRHEFLCSQTVAMEQPTYRRGGEALHSNIIDDYLRCFCSFRLRRIGQNLHQWRDTLSYWAAVLVRHCLQPP